MGNWPLPERGAGSADRDWRRVWIISAGLAVTLIVVISAVLSRSSNHQIENTSATSASQPTTTIDQSATNALRLKLDNEDCISALRSPDPAINWCPNILISLLTGAPRR